MSDSIQRQYAYIDNPVFVKRLFTDLKWAWLWLPVRLYLGWVWFSAGWERLNDVEWIASGEAVRRFWAKAVTTSPNGESPIAFGWYRTFIQMLLDGGHYTWFARLIVFTEVAIGVLLVIGAFTGFAAALSAFMSWNFIMAGATSANGLLFTLSILLLAGWRVAGHCGLDRKLLPALGTPWNRPPRPSRY